MSITQNFIGRAKELALLDRYHKDPNARFIVLHGRRRIGKSRLVDEFSKGKTYYNFTGLAPEKNITAQTQRDEFARRLGTYFNLPGLKADDWGDLFTILANQCQKGNIIILLDEISWMGMEDPSFLGKLRNAWDQEFKLNKDLMLVVCGSISIWIEDNLISNTGFVGRINHVLLLKELPLNDCLKFWGSNKNISIYEQLKFLCVSGGIPLYLEALNPKISAEENIRRLCFTAGSLLVREFNNIFSDLFGKNSDSYIDVIETLANGPLEVKEISQKLDTSTSGWISNKLINLEKSRFITRDYNWSLSSGEDSKLSRYRISDNYIRFYLKYIRKNLQKIDRHDDIFQTLSSLPGWRILFGFQFENLALNNRASILTRLKLHPSEIIADGQYIQRKTTRAKGCQIDYMIQTKFNNLYICEIKFTQSAIGPNIIAEVQEKINRLKHPKGYSCRPVLIHVNGVSEQVLDQDYFANIISFADLANTA